MPATSSAAYDPNDPLQQQFLSALALGETGGGAGAYTEGFGGTDLSHAAVDANGFPLWQGLDNSHAAGAFQFQPATWAPLALEYGLNFSNPADQNAGAWYEAQQADPNLETDLKSGNFSAVQTALAKIWPSVTGNAAAPQGLANSLATGDGAMIAAGAPGAAGTGAGGAAGGTASGGSLVDTIENFFVRFGLIIIGGIIVIVALWQLLASQGAVPSPAEAAKAAGAALAA